jgi:hypothetical protein
VLPIGGVDEDLAVTAIRDCGQSNPIPVCRDRGLLNLADPHQVPEGQCLALLGRSMPEGKGKNGQERGEPTNVASVFRRWEYVHHGGVVGSGIDTGTGYHASVAGNQAGQ